MNDEDRSVRVAVGLMRMALALLDKADQITAAAQLQHAIDSVFGNRPLRPGEELSPEMACLIAGTPLTEEPAAS